jgi:hypothetical protein
MVINAYAVKDGRESSPVVLGFFATDYSLKQMSTFELPFATKRHNLVPTFTTNADSVTVGGSGVDEGRDLGIDGSNNVYLAGAFENTVDFDPGAGTANRTSAGNTDIYTLSLDSSGNYRWAHLNFRAMRTIFALCEENNLTFDRGFVP